MRAEQIAQRMFNTLRVQVAKNDISTQLDIYQFLVDEIEREMGVIEDQSSTEDERFSQNHDEDEDEDE